jgi:hypothetical protein
MCAEVQRFGLLAYMEALIEDATSEAESMIDFVSSAQSEQVDLELQALAARGQPSEAMEAGAQNPP